MVTLEDKAEMFPAQLRQRVAVQRGDIRSGYAIGPAGRFIQAAENVHQRRFTGTRRADNCHHLARFHAQGDALQHLHRAVA